jgi:hypothetical protein
MRIDAFRLDRVEDERDVNDGVASLHDIEAEAGDEAELADAYVIDRVEAESLGVALDHIADIEPILD